jgi:hypothetical protein
LKKVFAVINLRFLFFVFLFLCVACKEDSTKVLEYKKDCEKIKDIVTDCLGLHRGAFDYVSRCGSLNYDEVLNAGSCEEVFYLIEEDQ